MSVSGPANLGSPLEKADAQMVSTSGSYRPTRDTPSSIIPGQAAGLSKGHSVPKSGLKAGIAPIPVSPPYADLQDSTLDPQHA